MGIIGLGSDLVLIERISRLRKKFGERFLCRIFHSEEIITCLKYSNPDQHLAARFAAKESLAKALGRGIFGPALTDICVKNDTSGRPGLFLTGRWEEICRDAGVEKIHLSLSHDGPVAQAVVILEGEKAK